MDDAVWAQGPAGPYFELRDPLDPTGKSLDMAFVITGEPVPIPGAVWLLGSGLIALVGLRRRSRG